MTKEEIINYILQSPENTNPNVLKDMIDDLGGGGDYKAVEILRAEDLQWEYDSGDNSWYSELGSMILEINNYIFEILPYTEKPVPPTSLVANKTGKEVSYIDIKLDLMTYLVVNFIDGNVSLLMDNGSSEIPPDIESIIIYKIVPIDEENTSETNDPQSPGGLPLNPGIGDMEEYP